MVAVTRVERVTPETVMVGIGRGYIHGMGDHQKPVMRLGYSRTRLSQKFFSCKKNFLTALQTRTPLSISLSGIHQLPCVMRDLEGW